MRLRMPGLAPFVLLAATSCAARAAPSRTEARVIRVVDGDTVVVKRAGVIEKCRLIGIDAPELSYGGLRSELDRLAGHTPGSERAELDAAIAIIRRRAAFAEEGARSACAALTDILGERSVTLVFDSMQPERDRYGRLLVYVEFDGLDVGAELVRRGLVVADERYECGRSRDYRRLTRSPTGALTPGARVRR